MTSCLSGLQFHLNTQAPKLLQGDSTGQSSGSLEPEEVGLLGAEAFLTLSAPRPIHREQLPESAYMHQLLGLNLLFLLSQNRVAEFHTELERLPAKDIQTNVYIKHPVSLEQVRLGMGSGRPEAVVQAR